MEYEISDLPGEDEREHFDGDEEGSIIENHSALRNQSAVNSATDYPEERRAAQSLVRPNKKSGD